MHAKNPGFSVTREGSKKLVVDTGTGPRAGVVFTLESDAPNSKLSMTSTKNAGARGVLIYTHDSKTGHWVNESDKHFLVELLTRDLLYHCQGYPAF